LDDTYLALIKAAGILSVSALLVAAGMAFEKKIVEAKIAMGVSLGATSTALLTTRLRH
jgi:hypothetical protein